MVNFSKVSQMIWKIVKHRSYLKMKREVVLGACAAL